ncbi:MAG: hypothetical protein COA41_04710 [Sphingopyxis sp.]|nr:MAG: hypothetical protein COA41_04710 [Sphingopyxis sp.]
MEPHVKRWPKNNSLSLGEEIFFSESIIIFAIFILRNNKILTPTQSTRVPEIITGSIQLWEKMDRPGS